MIIVRFPPSPTGYLHIGNARIALINWLFAKKNNGKIILRFDDTDTERGKEEYKTQMQEDLKWLGIEFDELFEQSKRVEIYKEAFEKLLQKGDIYPCFETEEELELKRKLQLSKGKPPLYERVNFTEEQKKNLPYFRFKLKHEEIKWEDKIQGLITYNGKDLSDPVILRANGNFMYTFCSIVDDFLMNISDIIRGADHITNTAIQIQIFNALCEVYNEKKVIRFSHLPLFQGKEGKISKRVGGFSIMEMRKNGFFPEAINNMLSKIGLSYYEDNILESNEMITKFDLSNFNKSQIMFDFDLLEKFNQKFIAKINFEKIEPLLSVKINENFFNNIKENITFLNEIEEWKNVLHGKNLNFANLLNDSDKKFIKNISILIEDVKTLTWNEMLNLIKINFKSRKGKEIFMPLRIALTGKKCGPSMHFIFEEIEISELKKRLK